MIAYKNILYCTDHSEDAEIALFHAVDMAQRHKAVLHVLHVLPSLHRYMPGEAQAGPYTDNSVDADPELLNELAQKLEARLAGRLDGLTDVRYTVEVGTPFVEILRYARENDIDLIVMGALGDSELGHTHYGSTVDQVSRRSHCHVMAIRNPEKTYTL